MGGGQMDEKKKKILLCFFYVVALSLIVSAAVLIWPVHRQYEKQQAALNDLRAYVAGRTAECIKLNRQVHELENSPQAVEKVAREKFGLCREGEIIMRYRRIN